MHTFRGVAAAKIRILTRFIEVKVFLKESLKCTQIYIVKSRLFINKKIYFMLKISVKRHVLSVLYDTPKSRDSRAVFLKSREK